MSDRVRHCPFLNRSDARCSSHFSLGHLSDALDQCFGQYAACGVYRELLLERRQRRGELPGQRDARPGTGPEAAGATAGPPWHDDPSRAYGSPIVPLTLSAAHAAAAARRYGGGH